MSRPLSAAPALPTPTPRASFPVLPGGDSPASRKPPSPTSRTSPDQDQSPTTDASPVSATAPHPPRIETPRSEGYPSWLPRRPRPPPPQSTVHSQHLDAYVDHPSMGERRPTSRSVRIVSVTPSQTSNENQSQHLPTEGGLAPPPRSPARAYSRHTSAALVSHLNPTPLPAMAPPPPRFATRGLNLQLLRDPSLLSRIRFYTLPLFVFAHIPLQAFFDLNVVYILLQ